MSGFRISSRRILRVLLAVYFLAYAAGLPWLHTCSEAHAMHAPAESAQVAAATEDAGHDRHAHADDGCPACAAKELPSHRPPAEQSRLRLCRHPRRVPGDRDEVVAHGRDLTSVLPRAPPTTLPV